MYLIIFFSETDPRDLWEAALLAYFTSPIMILRQCIQEFVLRLVAEYIHRL